jgi:DNA-binding NtrC family response regulator
MTKSVKSARVLLVDDDDTFRHVMGSELTRRGYDVVAASSGLEAVERFIQITPDVTLLDLRLPDMDGIEVLKRLRERNASAGVVVLTAHGTIDTAIRAIRLGAYDYLEKPCPIEKLEMAIQKTCEHGRLVRRQRVLEDGYAAPIVVSEIVGASPAFVKLMENVARIARTDSATLILGETGVGKEIVAKLLHAQSTRSDAPFVVVDCAALHEELLQSEIFGHEKGAFTGAARQKHGLFEVAHSGTIFLDEVGDTSLEVQAKLLRVLETGRFRRLGGTEEVVVDVRIVAATNRNLRQAISRGRFREDLFYRLATFTVEIPPLRERREDIRLLVEHFTRQFNLRFSVSKRFSEAAMDALMRHSWPGNVRELIHTLEQVVALCDDVVVGFDDLPASVRGTPESPAHAATGETATLRDLYRRHILSVLERTGGNRAQAARLLGTSERTFYRLLKRYGETLPASDPAKAVPPQKPEA